MLITILGNFALSAQEKTPSIEPSIKLDNSTFKADSSKFESDSTAQLPEDSLRVQDSTENKIDTTISKDAIESKVEYTAEDSMRFDMTLEKVYLYGSAQVNYEEIQLNANYIEVDLKNNSVLANGIPDSNGVMQGLPIFKEGPQEYEAGKMVYNFDTEKGKISEVKTQEGDGYIQGKEVKKTGKDVMYIRNGFYTTCNLDDPHFSLATSKLKVIPKDKIVTGPTVLKVGEVPTPLGLPFGFFPNKKGRSSGIIIPTYGDSRALGFFLRDGGFYWGINDNIDAAFTADIYSLGSWGGRVSSRYKKRYGYNGNVNLSYANIQNGYPEFPDFRKSTEFFVRWSHSQDGRARPGGRFSANVNVGTRNNFVNNLNSFTQDYLTNTFQSSISYSNAFPGRPYNLTLSARHNQNTQTGAFNVTLPDASFNVSRQLPFKSLGKIGNEWWRSIYKNFGLTYSSTATNQLSTIDSLLALDKVSEISQDFKNGMRHNIPVSTSFKVFKYFNMNPSMNVSDVWTLETYRQRYDTSLNQVVRDTVTGFERGGTVSFNTALTTKIYGMYQFTKGPVKAIRHVMTPQVSFNYQPEVTSGERTYLDAEGEEQEYNIFNGTVYGSPARQKRGRIGLNLLNNLEMKVKSKSDSTGLKKVSIFDNLGFSTNYDMNADSLNWSPISMNGRTRIGQFLTFQFNGSFDPYGIDTSGAFNKRVNDSWNKQTGKFVRLTSGTVALNFRLQGGNENKQKNQEKKSDFGTDAEIEHINANPDQYIDFTVPWSLNVTYNIRYNKPFYEETITQTMNFSGDLTVTENWKIGFNSGWDFEREDFTYTALNINRDLHCWQLAINWVPYGPRQSYMITLNVKSPVLQDLKLNRRRDFFDVIQ
ncbi:MAG: putative LPS assembly protein LptD [Vicingaceae bacterium]